MRRKQLGVYVLLWLMCGLMGSRVAVSEVIAVPESDSPNTPTQTFFWQGRNAQAVLLLIPGGEGHLNLAPQQQDVGPEFYQTLKQLSVGAETDGIFDVVLFSNPYPIPNNPTGYPVGRAADRHLSRIHSVIQFYKEKTGKPVWLMGHSNGAVSITEYLRYERKLGQPSLIAGLIVSGARSGASFDPVPLNMPVLFLHHRKDACGIARPTASFNNFKQVEASNAGPTSFVYIETGSPEARNACESGYHMYHEARPEVVAALRAFMVPLSRRDATPP